MSRSVFSTGTTPHPALIRTSFPEIPADTRRSPQRYGRKACSRRKSPPIPAQPATAVTGL